MELTELGKQAKEAARFLATAGTDQKNLALQTMADALIARTAELLDANRLDLADGEKNGLSRAMLDRLSLTEQRILAMADGMRQVADLPDPVGRVLDETVRPNGLRLTKVAVPIGVIAVIYEARPNVTADSAALCFKSGNAVILRGGSEALRSNTAAVRIMRDGLRDAGFPADCVQLIEDTDRETTKVLMRLNDYVDVLIPRGGAGLIRAVVENATVPVIRTGAGTCHIYVDKDADLTMAVNITVNAKTSRPSVCNAAECLLVHRDILKTALPLLASALREKGVELRADPETLGYTPGAVPADESDWGREYNDYIMAVHAVADVGEAISFISRYGTGHSECIVTENTETAERFLREVDAAAVYHNASTRFTDGGEFGLGAEIGISTQKLHARGPLGLRELTSMKYLVQGNGQVR
ncbi:MAG: glutamate-5-semialdehyde dehydrogenase [Clostridia bacterium]|nr:glutamate-5-semialdehyde dehydrogenase [Clostridia bacterium]MDY6183868.1 glutamate-5-semialdehyde dehydrogenase [Eubacteriales bacterium]